MIFGFALLHRSKAGMLHSLVSVSDVAIAFQPIRNRFQAI
ncbi:hypothetical protein RISK_003238 [Rhodopirellula islandica]|uniref:Uncharacterized protein n=1 Tax=Rhodopirellula islandica TaxID=595434 RepID=A0A0J1BDN5_RHOIS|nr:hypothetical protein RISK_003238 [Rhodopirellula islandica]